MKAIGDKEKAYEAKSSTSHGPATSSYHPLTSGVFAATNAASMKSQREAGRPVTDTSPWLPCHYFDYMAGTSTGGFETNVLRHLEHC